VADSPPLGGVIAAAGETVAAACDGGGGVRAYPKAASDRGQGVAGNVSNQHDSRRLVVPELSASTVDSGRCGVRGGSGGPCMGSAGAGSGRSEEGTKASAGRDRCESSMAQGDEPRDGDGGDGGKRGGLRIEVEVWDGAWCVEGCGGGYGWRFEAVTTCVVPDALGPPPGSLHRKPSIATLRRVLSKHSG